MKNNILRIRFVLLLIGFVFFVTGCSNNTTNMNALLALMNNRTYKVTYSLGGDVALQAPVDNNEYKTGDYVTLAQPPAREGFTFIAWNYNGNQYIPGSRFVMGTQNVTFWANWNQGMNNASQVPNLTSVSSPTFSLVGSERNYDGVVEAGTKVKLVCSTADAVIYYTLDGKVPDQTSTKYESPIVINSTVRIRAIAYKEGMERSGVSEKIYIVGSKTASPQFSFSEWWETESHNGSYNCVYNVYAGNMLTLSCSTPGADIYYTTNYVKATKDSTKYTEPIVLNQSVIIKTVAITEEINVSYEQTVKINVLNAETVSTPVFDVEPGPVAPGTMVTIECPTDGATIYYTTNGNTPTTSSSIYSSPISITPPMTLKAIAVKIGMKDSEVASADYTIMPAVMTPTFSVAAGAVTSGTTVTIDCATAGATIHYTTDGSTPTTANNVYSTPVTIDAAMTLKAIAVKSGMSDSAVASVEYTIEGSTGFLQGAGTVAKANIEISGTSYQKTSEVVVIPAGKQAAINMEDDSSWNTYIAGSPTATTYKGVFIKDRKVTLSPFVMGQYEVTQELYNAVIGSNPSNFNGTSGYEAAAGETQNLRPVENVNHYEAVAFCNELTKKTMTVNDVVYFSDAGKTIAYTTTNASNNDTPYMDITKKGYRLPTEAEWEYAARGGNPQSAEWKNAFGKVTAKDNVKVYDENKNKLTTDDNLATVGWYSGNASSITHEVGLKGKNNLNLYDMQGNVTEWCWDWYGDIATGNETDPVGAASGTFRIFRGGFSNGEAYRCIVSYHNGGYPYSYNIFSGFRVCRSAQ